MDKFIDDLERLLKLRKAADAETKPLIDKAIEALIAEHMPPRSITITPPAPPRSPFDLPDATPYWYKSPMCINLCNCKEN